MRKSVKTWAAAGLASLPLLLAGCTDKEEFINNGKDKVDAEIENAFDFKMTKTVPVSIQYPYFASVEVYDQLPSVDNKAKLLLRTLTGLNGGFKGSMTLPSSYIGKTVYAIANGVDCPLITEAKITADGLKIVAAKSESRAGDSEYNKYTDAELAEIQSGVEKLLPNEQSNYDYVEKILTLSL